MKLQLTKEFKRALNDRFTNSDLAHLYKHLFFCDFIDEEELENILLEYQKVYFDDGDDWFRQFHKMIRQTDFFSGQYYKSVNTLSEEERERRRYIISVRSELRRTDDLNVELPYDDELRILNRKSNVHEPISLSGVLDSMLYGLIHLDEKNELKTILEFVFKICKK